MVSSNVMPTWVSSTRRMLKPAAERGGQCLVGGRHGDRQRVEPRVVGEFEPACAQARRSDRRESLDAFGDAGQPVTPVPGRVQSGDVGQQHLGGADVRGGLLPPDVLLAGLQCESQRRASLGVDAHSDDAARHRTCSPLVRRQEAGMRAPRSPSAHRIAAPSRWRCRHRVGPAGRSAHTPRGSVATTATAAEFVHLGDCHRPVVDRTGRRREAEQRAEQPVA